MYTFAESTDRLQASQNSETKAGSIGDAYLKFAIDAHTTGLIESEFAQEVLTVKGGLITPVPNKPSCVLGIVSRRRRVYWAVDLAMMMGLQPLDQNILLYEVILLSAQPLALALVVPKIHGVKRVTERDLQTNVNNFPLVIKPYVKGYVSDAGGTCYLLKAENILRSTILHS
ncbi:MAG: hypothetical protein AUK48_10905 [Oscillatoriales cyanobacterium CG2_30_44_21]|nr:MAG: hypothetical protein AUK48_10905 [Oscillatoriales cyanobacterium CG2_30_44_21]